MPQTRIVSGSLTWTSASSKSFSKGSTTSISLISVCSLSRKPEHTPSNEPRVTRYRTRQTDSNSISLSKPPLANFRSASLQVAPAKPTMKQKKPPSHDSDVEEPEGVVYVPQTNFTGPPVMKENLRPDRSSLSPASKKLKLDPQFSIVYALSSLSEEHELTLPPSVEAASGGQGKHSTMACLQHIVPSPENPSSCTLPTPNPGLPAEALNAIMSPAPSSLTPLGSTPAHQSPVPSPPPSSPPHKLSVSYCPLSLPPSDLPEEPMADASVPPVPMIRNSSPIVSAHYRDARTQHRQ